MKSPLKLQIAFLSFVLALLCFVCTAATAQEFSAEIVQTQNNNGPSKIYVGKNKMRIESQGKNSKMGSVIMDFDTQMLDILMPAQHMYLESKSGQGHQRFRFFQAMNVEDACPEWRKMTDRPEGTCQKVGDETVNGRPAVEYETTSKDSKKEQVWIDSKIKFPIKWQGQNGEGELKNISEGAQPASLFEIPAGYQKMDMGNMMGHMPSR